MKIIYVCFAVPFILTLKLFVVMAKLEEIPLDNWVIAPNLTCSNDTESISDKSDPANESHTRPTLFLTRIYESNLNSNRHWLISIDREKEEVYVQHRMVIKFTCVSSTGPVEMSFNGKLVTYSLS